NNSHVYVARSTDGLHWSGPVDVASAPLLDKDWFVCDNGTTSPFRGRCYAEYTDDQKNTTVSQFSNDGGLTWSPAVRAGAILVGRWRDVGRACGQTDLRADVVARPVHSRAGRRSAAAGPSRARLCVLQLELVHGGHVRARHRLRHVYRRRFDLVGAAAPGCAA